MSSATAARAREFLVNFPSGWSQGFLAVVGSGYAIYYSGELGMFGLKAWMAERDDKERRREQFIQEAVEARAAATTARRPAVDHRQQGRLGRKIAA